MYKVEGKYFVDLGGMFGSRNAGDAWNLVMELVVASIRFRGNLRELNYFVDNYFVTTVRLQATEGLMLAEPERNTSTFCVPEASKRFRSIRCRRPPR